MWRNVGGGIEGGMRDGRVVVRVYSLWIDRLMHMNSIKSSHLEFIPITEEAI